MIKEGGEVQTEQHTKDFRGMFGTMSAIITGLVGLTQEMRAAEKPCLARCYRDLSSSSLQQPPPQLPIISH